VFKLRFNPFLIKVIGGVPHRYHYHKDNIINLFSYSCRNISNENKLIKRRFMCFRIFATMPIQSFWFTLFFIQRMRSFFWSAFHLLR